MNLSNINTHNGERYTARQDLSLGIAYSNGVHCGQLWWSCMSDDFLPSVTLCGEGKNVFQCSSISNITILLAQSTSINLCIGGINLG